MDKEKTSKETPKQKKSAPGIWEWILWILFLVLPVAVFVGVFGNTIWYALKMMPPKDDKMMSTAIPEGTIHGGMPAPIDKYGNTRNNMVKNGMAHKGE